MIRGGIELGGSIKFPARSDYSEILESFVLNDARFRRFFILSQDPLFEVEEDNRSTAIGEELFCQLSVDSRSAATMGEQSLVSSVWSQGRTLRAPAAQVAQQERAASSSATESPPSHATQPASSHAPSQEERASSSSNAALSAPSVRAETASSSNRHVAREIVPPPALYRDDDDEEVLPSDEPRSKFSENLRRVVAGSGAGVLRVNEEEREEDYYDLGSFSSSVDLTASSSSGQAAAGSGAGGQWPPNDRLQFQPHRRTSKKSAQKFPSGDAIPLGFSAFSTQQRRCSCAEPQQKVAPDHDTSSPGGVTSGEEQDVEKTKAPVSKFGVVFFTPDDKELRQIRAALARMHAGEDVVEELQESLQDDPRPLTTIPIPHEFPETICAES